MIKDIRFGIFVPAQFVSFPQAVEHCQLLEALGYDSIWIGDHFQNRVRASDPMFEAWTLLAALAARTNRIRLGTLVTSFIYRNPTLVAKQALTVDHISNGRLELGLGAGERMTDHTMAGVDPWKPHERAARFREAVEIVDYMLRHEITTFEGRYYRVQEAVRGPAPIQQPRPPLTIGGSGSTALKIAAQYADNWNTLDISMAEWRAGAQFTAKEALEVMRSYQERIDEYCVEMRRQPSDLQRSLLVGYRAEAPTDSIDAFYEYVQRYHGIGFTEFIFYWLPDDYRELVAHRIRTFNQDMVERVAAEAIPALRKN
jgi:alkanesulfonate monooxygenase SsuD/methylene tetrahydromethanopterin reductase-like flavin-dependent oxidoreductase (luciferase family)